MNIDKELLTEIFRIPAPSGREAAMAAFIKKKLDKMLIPYEEDKEGNVFHFSGEKPFLNAHMDTVQGVDDCLLVDFISIKENSIIDGLGVIGGDDKCGIYIILRMLEAGYDFNFAFTVSEEIGTIGSRYLCKTKRKELEECLYGLTLDRKGNSDIICFENNYGTSEFEKALHEVGKEFDYKPAMGVLSDADEFNEFMSLANLSVGYYQQHSKKEFVLLKDLEKAERYVEQILIKINSKFDAPDPVLSYGYNYGYGYDYGYDYGYGKNKTALASAYSNYGEDLLREEETWEEYLGEDFFEIKCNICGAVEELTFLRSLDNYYCNDCMVDIADEISEKIEFEYI